MADSDDISPPWLSIVGLGEDGIDGLSAAARETIARADLVVGGARHLALIASLNKPTLAWEIPFENSIPKLLAQRSRNVVVLASGDPFWFGVGSTLAAQLPMAEMRVFPAPSTFGLAAARLGWPLEHTVTLGLHARPIALLWPHLRPGARLIVLLRDGAAPALIAAYLEGLGFGRSKLFVLEALGGPRERIRASLAQAFSLDDVQAPVALAIEVEADADALVIPRTAGLPDELFRHDGQLTKREIRAVTLSSLAPRGGELLWDIGAGSGAVGIEWLLADPHNRAIGIEARADRLETARSNASALGVPHLDLRHGHAPDALAGLPTPDAVFVGGGAGEAGVFAAVWQALKPGGRLVINAVTLETEALLSGWQARHGGSLLRLSVERAGPVGDFTAWRAAMPIVQWSVRK
jgi:precorrin-6Y C5,15-methyltransferase (decarboxylating)